MTYSCSSFHSQPSIYNLYLSITSHFLLMKCSPFSVCIFVGQETSRFVLRIVGLDGQKVRKRLARSCPGRKSLLAQVDESDKHSVIFGTHSL